MKHILCFIGFIGLTIQSNPCFSSTTENAKTTINKSLEKQAEAFLQGYAKHLNQYLSGKNLMAIKDKTSQDIRLPSHVIQTNGNLVEYDSSEKVIKNYTGFLERIKGSGVQAIKWQELNTKVINDFAVLAENTAALLNSQGEVIRTIKAVYVLHKSEDNWAIALRIPQTY